MKEAILVDVNGVHQGVELVSLSIDGVMPIYAAPEPPQEGVETPEQVETPDEPPEPVLTGYRVAIPIPQGMYAGVDPANGKAIWFDMTKWAAYVKLRDAPLEYIEQDDGQGNPVMVPVPRSLPDPSTFWCESLTPEEIAERSKPQPVELTPEQKRISALESDNLSLMLALTQVYETLLTLDGGAA